MAVDTIHYMILFGIFVLILLVYIAINYINTINNNSKQQLEILEDLKSKFNKMFPDEMATQHGLFDWISDNIFKPIADTSKKVGTFIADTSTNVGTGIAETAKKIGSGDFKGAIDVISDTVIKVGSDTINLGSSTVKDIVTTIKPGTDVKIVNVLESAVKDNLITKVQIYQYLAKGDTKGAYNLVKTKTDNLRKINPNIPTIPPYPQPIVINPTNIPILVPATEKIKRDPFGTAPSNYLEKDFVVYSTKTSDLPNQPIRGNLQTCMQTCNNNSNCVAFSRPKNIADSQVGECWLKKDIINNKKTNNDKFWRTYVKN